MKGHNPNDGENQTNYSSGGSPSASGSAGVSDGLSSLDGFTFFDVAFTHVPVPGFEPVSVFDFDAVAEVLVVA